MSDEIALRTLGPKRRLVDRAAEEIEAMIVSRALQPSAKLPSQRELAMHLGVSRTVVREAMSALAAKGFVETRSGVGNTVRQATRDQVVERLSLFLRTHKIGVSFEDLHQVRTILELEVARIAAARISSVELEKLEELCRTMEASIDDPATFASADTSFHFTLAQATRNPLLEILSASVNELLGDYLREVIPMLDVGRDVTPYHRRILDSLLARDPEASRKAMEEHLDQVLRNQMAAMSGDL
jgi:GntR family transcriptional repressor for pyruvate dehydrogenase complex